MSLSSLLLASGEKDAELDALFNTTAAPVAGPSTIKPKNRKSEVLPKPEHTKVKSAEKMKRKAVFPEVSPGKKSKRAKVEREESADEEDDNGALEDAYEAAKAGDKEEKSATGSESEGDDDGDPSALVHESVKRPKAKRKEKYVPSDETKEQRDSRTVFVGNLPVQVAQNKAGLKQLKRHIVGLVPSAKIESVRFRSIAFQSPTSKLPDEDEAASGKKPKQDSSKTPRPQQRDRTSAWKNKEDHDESTKTDEKQFLTPSQKKRIAFINQEFHSEAASVNAYVVLAHTVTDPTASPYDAAQLVAQICDGTMFMERAIRADVVGSQSDATGDPKLTIFVGNLDFATKDEDLRVFFEGVVSTERGPPEQGSKWVTRVRIVRDRETQLGKGFAYVQFIDHQCIDEMLALEEGKLKFAKRKLRVARCKSVTKSRAAASGANAPPTMPKPFPVPIRLGDPALGKRIAHLSKDARKDVKAKDADRVARRMEKKKARGAMAKQAPDAKARDRVRKKPTAPSGGNRPKPAKRVRSERSVMMKNTKKQ